MNDKMVANSSGGGCKLHWIILGDKNIVDGILSGSQQVGNAKLHNGWRIYTGKDYAELGLAPGTCTISEIYAALPDNSEIYIDSRGAGWAGNPDWPGGSGFYGTIHIARLWAGRAIFEAATNGGGTYYVGTFNTTYGKFDGWQRVATQGFYELSLTEANKTASARMLAAQHVVEIAHCANGVYDNSNKTTINASDDTEEMSGALQFTRRRNGVNAYYTVMGEHNVTISNTAPAATLKKGEVHMTY